MLSVVLISVKTTFAGEVVLQDDKLSVAFDSKSGALTKLENKAAHWTIERRPELGVAFRLFAPLPERRWNPVFVGNSAPDDTAVFASVSKTKPRAAAVKKISDHEILLQWTNLTSETGVNLPVTLTSAVTLTNGILTFHATLQNDSALTIETIDYPFFGDFNSPSRDAMLELRVMNNNRLSDLRRDEIYPHFGNDQGYWGVFWPLKKRDAQLSRFCLISSTNAGVFAEIPAASYRLQWTFEQHPGVLSSASNLVPPQDVISGRPVYLEFRACHFIFAAPHSLTNLMPVTVRGYQGDWHSGLALYEK